MNLMKDRIDDIEGWEDIEHNIENSVEKYPNSNRERFADIFDTGHLPVFLAHLPIKINQSLPQKLPLVKMSVLLLYKPVYYCKYLKITLSLVAVKYKYSIKKLQPRFTPEIMYKQASSLTCTPWLMDH